MKRITLNSLKDWVNEQFLKLEITEYECTKVTRSHFTSDQYESGACKLYIHFRLKGEHNPMLNSSFYCFYSIKELQSHIKDGYEMYLNYKSMRLLSIKNLEIELRKPTTNQSNLIH